MKIYHHKFNKILSLLLLLIIVILAKSYYFEYQKNKPYKQEIESLEKTLIKTKKENILLKKQIAASFFHPLEREKEIKDKMGEALPGEKVIFVSKEVLNSISFSIFSKKK